MVLRSSNRNFQLTDISGIALHLYQAEKSLPVSVTITGFDFTCDTKTGDVSRETTAVAGNIHHRMSEDQMAIYEYNIKLALTLAARRELIDRIQGLGDKKLNDVIPDQVSDPKSLSAMSELSINGALAAIMREVKPASSLLGKFGFSAPPRSEQQKAVHASLRKGVANINTYTDVERIWSDVTTHLQHPAKKGPTPTSS